MKSRVIAVFKDLYKVETKSGEINSHITGNMIKNGDFPVVGDYVEVSSEGQIVEIYPRRSVLSRKTSGKAIKEQPIVSNVDYIFIVTSLNKDFNIARLERYLTIVYDSGASPCFILTKADLEEETDSKVSSLEEIAFGVPVHVVSSYNGKGIEEIKSYLKNNKVIGLIGSSGVGKSTLINKLLGREVIETREIREGNDKGKHTTTRREMYRVEEGYVIDTPGMRELQIWSGDTSSTFGDIEDIAARCRFSDCTHTGEPGCAVRESIDSGDLREKRLVSYQKLKREITNMENKVNHGHRFAEKEKIKNIMGSLDMRKKVKSPKK